MLAAPVAADGAQAGLTLSGTRSAALSEATDLGAVSAATTISGTRLILKRTASQQAAFDQLVEAQQDPASPLYHRWLSASEIGTEFGPSEAAVTKVTDWLRAQGFNVDSVSPTRLSIAFSGSAGTVSAAFAAPVHAYQTRGRQLDALSADPTIPADLADTVTGITGLGGNHPEPQVRPAGPVYRSADGIWHAAATGVSPNLTTTYDGAAQEDVAPADFATIYNVTPLRTAASPTLGTGQTIAVVEDSDIKTTDWTTFRTAFGLSSYAATLTVTHPGCSDPGKNGDEIEAALDAEWATAVAPAAAITLASCSDASGGVQASLEGLVDAKTPPHVISVSFGECESELGSSAASSWAALLEQGAAEGVSIFVSTGDSGSAGCDQGATIATHGISVNGLASSQYDVAVGGTDFSDFASKTVSTYWNTTNTSTYGSAKSYIPEIPWNDTCANPVLASYEGSSSTLAFCNTTTGHSFLAPGGGGGGASTLFAKPSFQSGVYNIPNDGHRDLPDVVLFASNGLFGHALVYCMSDTSEGGSACTYTSGAAVVASSAGGTSFAAPAFAGIQALIDQHKGASEGNPDARLYALSIAQGNQYGGSCTSSYGTSQPAGCVFHDITTGGNDQACKSGSTNCYSAGNSYGVLSTSSTSETDAYSAASGFDLTTGLGSVNVANLVAGY
jgi:subtilase family serine protease